MLRRIACRAPLRARRRAAPTPRRGQRHGRQASTTTTTQQPRHEGGRRLGVYLHWPYCRSICTYCDFVKYVARPGDDTAAIEDALVADCAAALGDTRAVQEAGAGPLAVTVYFGGGTPSLARPDLVARVLDCVRAVCRPAPGDGDGGAGAVVVDEVTLECNPRDVSQDRLHAFQAAGVTRVSLGVQSLDNSALQLFGRDHDADGAHRAMAAVADTVANWSIDLIYARPGQSPAAWEAELGGVLAAGYGFAHLSAYELTLMQNSKLGRVLRQRGLALPDADTTLAFLETTADLAERHGLPQYEVCSFARPGAESRHNSSYWRGTDYVGVGPGAHSRYHNRDGQRVFASRVMTPGRWATQVQEEGHGERLRRPLQPSDTAEEVLGLGLRMVGGVTRSCWDGVGAGALLGFDALLAAPLVGECVAEGLLRSTTDALVPTRRGLAVADAMAGPLIAEVARLSAQDHQPVGV